MNHLKEHYDQNIVKVNFIVKLTVPILTLKNKWSLLASTVPWRAFNVHGTYSFYKNVLSSEKRLFTFFKCYSHQEKNGKNCSLKGYLGEKMALPWYGCVKCKGASFKLQPQQKEVKPLRRFWWENHRHFLKSNTSGTENTNLSRDTDNI